MLKYELTRSQQRAVNYILENDETAIKGKAGSGKTLVGAEAANRLVVEQVSLLEDQYSNLPVTFATYTGSLVNYTKNNLVNNNVQVLTVHSLLRRFLSENNRYIKYGNSMSKFLKENLDTTRYSINFMKLEFGFIYGKGLKTKEAYLTTDRVGRGRGRVDRTYIFNLFQRYDDYLRTSNVIAFEDIGNEVLDFCANNDYQPIVKHLIIDEIQDLSVTVIQALQKVVAYKKVYIGDIAQSIYGTGFTWIENVGRSMKPIDLAINFRNTQQIDEAADSVLKYEYIGQSDVSEDYSLQKSYANRTGSKPQAFFCNNIDNMISNIKTYLDGIFKTEKNTTIGIGYRNIYQSEKVIEKLRKYFRENKIRILDKNSNDIKQETQVYLMSFHSLKGLEFDYVILLDLDEKMYFNHIDEMTSEVIDVERRLFFVAMTRAKDSLALFSRTDKPVRFLSELSPNKITPVIWNRESYDYTYSEQIELLEETRKLIWEEYYTLTSKIEKLEENIERMSEDNKNQDSQIESLFTENEELVMLYEEEIQRLEQEKEQVEQNLLYTNVEKKSAQEIIETETREFTFRKDAKIVILGGDGGIKEKDIGGILKSVGLNKSSFEYVSYRDVEKLDVNKYMSKLNYSDIFISTTPHKARGIRDSSSVISYYLDNQKDFPKVQVCKDSNGNIVKFSKSKLKKMINNSDLYASVKGI